MCDIPNIKCGNKKCKRTFEIHIVDFIVPRKLVVPFCNKHAPRKDVMFFDIMEEDMDFGGYKKGEVVAIKVNHPVHRYNVDISPNCHHQFRNYGEMTRTPEEDV